MLDALEAAPDVTAIEHGSLRVSRGELRAMVRQIAGGLRAAGLRPGSTVALAVCGTARHP
jgi:non-ribosomal peptide synthetase component E (peptide arylation enzyme)